MKEKLVHELVPEHVKLTEKEKEKVLEQYKILVTELPKISMKDPAIRHIEVKVGDVIKIMRNSSTAGQILFYRGVVDE